MNQLNINYISKKDLFPIANQLIQGETKIHTEDHFLFFFRYRKNESLEK